MQAGRTGPALLHQTTSASIVPTAATSSRHRAAIVAMVIGSTTKSWHLKEEGERL